MTQVTSTYIDGIKEGRGFLKNNPNMTESEMQLQRQRAASLMRAHSQPMKDLFKGERDFWKAQLEKLNS